MEIFQNRKQAILSVLASSVYGLLTLVEHFRRTFHHLRVTISNTYFMGEVGRKPNALTGISTREPLNTKPLRQPVQHGEAQKHFKKTIGLNNNEALFK